MKPSILIVDDNDAVRLSLTEYLQDNGHEVVSVCNADDGLMVLYSFKPNLAIVDLRLPTINGVEFIHKAHKQLPNLKFMIYTGSLEVKLPDETIRLGCVLPQVVIKPLPNLSNIDIYINKMLNEL